jgi:hypothetical protein
MPHGLMADVDAALEQQILDVPQRRGEANLHHNHEADHLGRRIEHEKWARRLGSGPAGHQARLVAAQLV